MGSFTLLVLGITTIGSAAIVSAFILAGIRRVGAHAGLSQLQTGRWGVIAAIALFGWGVATSLLFISGFYDAAAIRVNLGLILPILTTLLIFAFSPGFRRLLFAMPLAWLIGIQLYRIAGVRQVVLFGQGAVPPQLAVVGIGDIVVGVTALLVALALSKNRPNAKMLAAAWAAFNIADLLYGFVAISSARAAVPPFAYFGTLPFIVQSTWFGALSITCAIFIVIKLLRERAHTTPVEAALHGTHA